MTLDHTTPCFVNSGTQPDFQGSRGHIMKAVDSVLKVRSLF